MSLTKATYSMIKGAPVNVLDYGAVGDGITDDTAAIQAAINYAGTFSRGADVVFPPGRYIVTAALTIPSFIRLVGNSKLQGGSAQLVSNTAANIFTLTAAAPSSFAFFDLHNMHIEGARNKTQEFVSTPAGVSWAFSTIDGCYLVNIPKFTILATGLHFINNNFQNIWKMEMRGADCNFESNYIGYDTFYGNSLTTDVLVSMVSCGAYAWTDNYISSFPEAPATVAPIAFSVIGSNDSSLIGNRIDGGTARTLTFVNGSHRITVIGNRFASITATQPIFFSNVTQITFNDNMFANLSPGQEFASGNSILTDIIVHNNQTNSRTDTSQHDFDVNIPLTSKVSVVGPNLTYKNTTAAVLYMPSTLYGRVITNTGGTGIQQVFFYSANMVPLDRFYFSNTGARLVITDGSTSTNVYDSSTSGYTTGQVVCYVAGTATVSSV